MTQSRQAYRCTGACRKKNVRETNNVCLHQYAIGNRANLDALVHAVQAQCRLAVCVCVCVCVCQYCFIGCVRPYLQQPPCSRLPNSGWPRQHYWTHPRLRVLSRGRMGAPRSPALFCLGLQPPLPDLQRELRADLGVSQQVSHLVHRFEHHFAHHTQHKQNRHLERRAWLRMACLSFR